MMTIQEFQQLIQKVYGAKDSERGIDKNFLWLAEEVGELAEAIRKEDKEKQKEEFADVFAWLATLANLLDVDLEESAARFAKGCPNCRKLPCACKE